MIKIRRRSTLVQSQSASPHQEAALSDSTNTNTHSNDNFTGMRNSTSPQKSKVARKALNIFDAPRKGFLDKSKCKKNSPRKAPDDRNCSSNDSPVNISSCGDNTYSMQIDEDSNSYHDDESNLMSWLHNDAPEDILPKILSLAGPQTIQILSRVSKSWNNICLSETVFRSLCEDTGKWVFGKDPEPGENDDKARFWKDYYWSNPIVPTDYASIPAAVNAVSDRKKEGDAYSYSLCRKSVRIFLRQGDYVLHDQVRIETVGNVTFSVETLHNVHGVGSKPDTTSIASELNANMMEQTSPRRRRLLSCCSTASSTVNEINSNFYKTYIQEDIDYIDRLKVSSPNQATIYLRTKIPNTPIFHIRQGTMRLSKLTLVHNAGGVDIWNGNTAVQIQPRLDHHDRVVPLSPENRPPRVFAEGLEIMSLSGRGIVTIDGGFAFVRKCYIHECAATGIYVGGPGSRAKVEESDIMRNGNGNVHATTRNIITRGHSGVYLEQGIASLIDCNVSKNSLTGISAVSPSNAILTLKKSDIVGNGTLQLEMPPEGSISRKRSVIESNNLSSQSCGRHRSSLVPIECKAVPSTP